MAEWKNQLYFGDNLDVLRNEIPDESVDLVYLDPPFKSNASYNVLFEEKNGSESTAQITAFEDTWHWGTEAEEAFDELVDNAPSQVMELMRAYRRFLGTNDMMAYLVMMAPRLLEMRRVLKSTGSIYLHCDPTASHYLKMLMDAVFGAKQFRNEIVWNYETGGIPRYDFARKHDIIFRYTKTEQWTFKAAEVAEPRSDEVLRRISTGNPGATRSTGQFRHPSDVFSIAAINAMAKERLGYPTQKPEDLLERIIKASSNEGEVVLDPFCGCGTTIAVAERLKRRWIGIDITHLAVNLMRRRLEDTFDEVSPYEINGLPDDLEGAKELAKTDRYEFEYWALDRVNARPAQDKKKGADKGVDGYLYFRDDNSGEVRKVVIQVKSGKVGPDIIRDLKSTRQREEAEIGVLITLRKPTRPMTEEAIEAGFYTPQYYQKCPRIQILTVEDVLNGENIDYPGQEASAFKKAKGQSKMQQPGLI